jgi:putative ABC transport system permease protein
MLNADFVKWVLAAIAISVRFIWPFSKWMERFAYRNAIACGSTLLPDYTAIIIAVLTNTWQSWKRQQESLMALRYE